MEKDLQDHYTENSKYESTMNSNLLQLQNEIIKKTTELDEI